MALGRAALPTLASALLLLLAAEFLIPPGRGERDETRGAAIPAGTAVLLLACVALFALLQARTGLVTDGISIWAAKAKAILVDRGLSPRAADPAFLGRYARYPPLLPLGSALVAMIAGFDATAAKAFEPLFFASLLLSVWAAARRLVPAGGAAAAALVVAFLPAVSTDWNAGGFADLPLAALAAGAAAALLGRDEPVGWRSAAAWHLAALTAVKREGAILALVGGFAAVAGPPGEMLRTVRRRWREAAIVLLALALQAANSAWMALPDEDFSRAGWAVLAKAGTVVRATAAAALDPYLWGLFWPAAAAAVVVLARRGTAAERRAAAAVAFAVLLDASIFLFSTWDRRHPQQGGVAGHVAIAYPRLLEQVAGAASIVLVAGWRRAFSRARA